jgi:hypothetical protein
MSRAQGEVEMTGQSNHKRKSSSLGQSKRLPDRSPSQLRKSEEIVVYQQNAATLFRGKRTIFELTDMVKTASCRAYPEELSGL